MIRQGSVLDDIRHRAAMALCFVVAIACVVRAQDEETTRRFRKAVLIRFEGEITPLLEQFIYRKLDVAKDQGADLLIIEIDSPGGYRVTSVNLAERFRDLEWAHTVAFVPRQAYSGAAIAALGCDEIVMAPDAHLGDVGLIIEGEGGLFRHAPEKERSVLALQIRELAEAKGRPPALVEAMVNMDLVVYQVRNKNTGVETFLSDHEIESSDAPGDWAKLQPVHESREKNFLTVTGTRAVELKLAEGIAATRDEIKLRYGIEGELLVLKPTGVDTTVTILNIPFVTGLLLLVGLIALYVEFSAPGLGVGGVIAAICFTLFFWSKFLGGTAVWLEVILFLLGVVFLLIEIFVTPGFGFAGITGMVLIVVSLVMAGQDFVIPTTPRELNASLQGLVVIVGAGFAFVIGAIGVSHYFGTVPIVGWLKLELPRSHDDDIDDDGKPSSIAGSNRFPVGIGDWGVAESPLRPAGKAIFGDAYLDVVADGSFVDKGTQVRVIQISGNRIVVREIEDAGSGQVS
ncbi:MAG: peptidase [Planctomycetota bacterium]|nr:peptidase [Planctomycetota bacterium]